MSKPARPGSVLTGAGFDKRRHKQTTSRVPRDRRLIGDDSEQDRGESFVIRGSQDRAFQRTGRCRETSNWYCVRNVIM